MKKSLAVFLSWVALLWATGAVNAVAKMPGADDAADFTPKYDIAGNWISDNAPEHGVTTRTGKHVKAVYNTAGSAHVFEGDYVDGNTVVGIQTRKSHADGSATRMAVMVVLDSADDARGYWVALDSNSDLKEGQTAQCILKRVKPAVADDAAADFTPKYDITGIWNSGDGPSNATMTRTGRHVKVVYNNGGYEHVFEGDYVDGVTITGIQVRKSKSDGSVTRMAVTLVMQSADAGKVYWVGLDSNSDLTEGQSATCNIKRVSGAA